MRRRSGLVAWVCCVALAGCVSGETPAVQLAAVPPAPPPAAPSAPPVLPAAPPLPAAAPVAARASLSDPRFARALDQFAGACGALQAYVVGAQLFGSEKRRATMQKAAIVLDRLCNDPPRDVETAVARAAEAYAAIQVKRERR
jgi:hypothetical protein